MANASIKSTVARIQKCNYNDLEELKKVKIPNGEQESVLKAIEKIHKRREHRLESEEQPKNEFDALLALFNEGKPLKLGPFLVSSSEVRHSRKKEKLVTRPKMLIELLILVLPIYSNPIAPSLKTEELQEVKPDYKVIKYTYTRDNDTDVMDQELPNLQIIPLDFLCEFCQVVILKLKERQATEPDFEQTIKAECQNSTDDSSSLCDVINRVNLDRLKNDDPKEICQSQNMCNGVSIEGSGAVGPPATSPEHGIATGKVEEEDVGKHLTVDEKDVNATLHVEDIAPY
ncbi:unnamed protein product [Caenorhabditis sp. 36 PRJEB53466]|nr:unnamed protein product [Caenorhabditis sp. 36 PRJEB53466]